MQGFSPAVLEKPRAATIKVGFMKKPRAATVRAVSKDLYIHVSHHEPWLAAAISTTPRSQYPLTGNTFLQELRVRAFAQQVAKQLQEDQDPMGSLEAGGPALAGPETPQKRARVRRMVGSAEERESPIDVRVVDVVADINVFPPHARPTMEQAFFRVLCVSSTGKGGPKMRNLCAGGGRIFGADLNMALFNAEGGMANRGVQMTLLNHHVELKDPARPYDEGSVLHD